MENNIIMDEQMKDMLLYYKEFKKELDKQEAIEKREIFNMLRGHLDSIRSLRNKIIIGGCLASALPWLAWINNPLPMKYRIITSALALIITIGICLVCSGINGDFVPDVPLVDYSRKLKKRKKVQGWWTIMTWLLIAFWYGFSFGAVLKATLPTWGTVLAIAFVSAVVVALFFFVTRIHNRIIGQYEGVILRLDNPEAADWIGE